MCNTGNIKLLHLLVDIFPRHQLPLRVATQAGQLQAVKFMYSMSRDNEKRYGFINLLLVAKIASAEQHYHILEWLDNLLTGNIWKTTPSCTATHEQNDTLLGWKTISGSSVPKVL